MEDVRFETRKIGTRKLLEKEYKRRSFYVDFIISKK